MRNNDDIFYLPLVGTTAPGELIVHNAVALIGLEDERYREAFRGDAGEEANRATTAYLQGVSEQNDAEGIGRIVGVRMHVRRYVKKAGIPLTLVMMGPWCQDMRQEKREAANHLPTFALGAQLRKIGDAPRRTVGYVAVASPEQLTILTRGLAFKVIPPEKWAKIKRHGVAGNYGTYHLSAQDTQTEPGHPVKYPEGSVVAMDVPVVDYKRLCNPISTSPNSPGSDSPEVVLLNDAVSVEPKKTRHSDSADAFALRWFPAESSHTKRTG